MIAKVERTYFNDTISGSEVVMPNSVNTICPFCKRNVHIQMTWKYQLNKEDNYCSVQCPNCKKKLRFIYLVDPSDAKNLDAGQLYMDPGFQERRLLEGIEENDKLPNSLKRAYLSAVTVYNAREWTSTAVMCRRVLEGIVKTINPSVKPNANLARSLENLRTTMDFNKPIMTIADAIRKGGNFGAHFDEEKEPNEEVSKLMIDLLDYLIEYLFILPARIEVLHDTLEKLTNIERPSPEL
jgi:hypothetical protein